MYKIPNSVVTETISVQNLGCIAPVLFSSVQFAYHGFLLNQKETPLLSQRFVVFFLFSIFSDTRL
jgi:hypothetical protein